jgi:hypothetical protein
MPFAAILHEPVCTLGGQKMGKVGIFWFYEGIPLFVAAPLQHGIDDGDFMNGPDDHLLAWGKVRCAVPALRTVEYDEVPRGRVIYKKAEDRFVVYMDKVLHRDDYKRAILHLFALPPETPFLTDIHYTTTSADLERLFDDLR